MFKPSSIDDIINKLKTARIPIKLSGSYLLNELTYASDIDLKCFTDSPLQMCQKVHKMFNYVYPYYVYHNLHRNHELMCNLKIRESEREVDLVFLPKHYESLYLAVEQMRNNSLSPEHSEYMKVKKAINRDIYVSGTMENRLKHFDRLHQIKDKYFDQVIREFCQKHGHDYKNVKSYFQFGLTGGYIGRVKIG